MVTFLDVAYIITNITFSLQEIVELRKSGWASKEDEKGPKTIQEIHEEVS